MLSDVLEQLHCYLRVARAKSILRRYFVMNAFDGSMTSLGMIIGAYITDVADSVAIIGIIMIGAVAMAVSGFAGTYMTESAERSRALNELEDAMLVDLRNTVHGEASRIVPLLASVVDGAAPFLASLPALVPFALVVLTIMPIRFAFYASIGACLATLFALGAFLGRISQRNMIYFGVRMVTAGSVVALLALLLD